MDKFYTLSLALEYIEAHILENSSQADIAAASMVSLSSLQKLFRYTFGYSVNEYITKRKMTLAAEELLEGKASIAALALKYGAASTEAFSRAFSRVNCALPSDFRRKKGAQAVFTPPKFSDGGITRESPYLIEAMSAAADCFVVCFDVVGMVRINQLSREAGDLALMEAVRRIHAHTAAEMRIFRIGQDEFAVITRFEAAEQAETLSAAVLAHNGESFFYKAQPVPLFLRSWYGRNTPFTGADDPAGKLQKNVKYMGGMETGHGKAE